MAAPATPITGIRSDGSAAPQGGPKASPKPSAEPQAAESTAVVAVPQTPAPDQAAEPLPAPFQGAITRLPVELDVVVPVRDFRVRDLLALESGQVVESRWSHGDDVPLTAGEVALAWSEFEVIDNQLAVRITRLP